MMPAAEPPKPAGRFAEVKNFVIKVLIGCLVVAAGLAVVAVLSGGMSDILSRSLLTLGLVAAHAVAALAYISSSDMKGENGQDLTIFSNAVFTVIVLSFITSVFGTWNVIGGDVVGKLYLTYFVSLFAVLHGEMLYGTTGKTTTIDRLVLANYIFMVLVVLMLLPLIWAGTDQFGEFYYRPLAALGIIDATLTITAVALHKLYLNKHPQEQSQLFTAQLQLGPNGQPVAAQVQPKRRTNPLLLLFGLYLAVQLVISLVFAVMGGFRH